MQDVLTGRREYSVREDVDVPYGTRVSWQALWAGTMTTFATTILWWALALAIIALTMSPTAGSVHGAIIAAWICLMATTLVGNFFGGMVAAWVRGSAKVGVGLLHGFITWALTFVLGVLFGAMMLRGLFVGLANAIPGVVSATATTTAPKAAQTSVVGNYAIGSFIALGWSWWGTWIVSLGFSLAGAALGVRRARGAEPERVERRREIPPMTPLTPAPTS